jgi:hypothetical protein
MPGTDVQCLAAVLAGDEGEVLFVPHGLDTYRTCVTQPLAMCLLLGSLLFK